MRAVSTSRISPTRIASGSWRSTDRRPVGEREAGRLVDLDLVDRREDVLDGVLDRHDVDLVAVDRGERRVQRGGLARARSGPRRSPCRTATGSCRSSARRSRPTCRARAARSPRASCRGFASRTSRRTRSASSTRGRRGRGRRSSTAIWPSCGRRRSTMFMSDMTLIRLTSDGPIGPGQRRDLVQRAVGADAHAHGVGHRLDVHVGGAVVHGLLEDDVDDLDDRRVLVDDGLHDGVGRLRRLARLEARFEHAQRVAEIGRRRVASGRSPARGRCAPRA